jgi:dolichol-phosphate mannosyltransferase
MDEQDNIPGLINGVEGHPHVGDQRGLHQIAELYGDKFTVIFVDDSSHTLGIEASDKVRQGLCGGSCDHIAIKHIHRTGKDKHGGLSGAVTDGVRAARELDINQVVVMDGDLQHDPRYVPWMLTLLGGTTGANLVSTSRYAAGGSSKGLDSFYRHLVSRTSTLLAKALFPRRLRLVSDPMSGLFAFHVHAVNLTRLNPQGFKILVEILLTHPTIRRTEMQINFGPRADGESKSNLQNGLTFLRQLFWHRLVK